MNKTLNELATKVGFEVVNVDDGFINYEYTEKISGVESVSYMLQILDNASKYVKVGGTLIYSTCTIQDNENIDVVQDFLNSNNNFKLVPINEVKVDLDNQDSGYLKIYPNIHDIDGFFIAKLERVR